MRAFAVLGIAALLVLLWILRPNMIEPFEVITGKADSFVVVSTLQTLTLPDILQTIGSLERGSYLPEFAVKTIENTKGEIVWKAGDPALSDTNQLQYRLTFPQMVTLSTPPPGGQGGPDIPGKFQTSLPNGVVFVGEAFTSPYIIVESTIGILTDPYSLRILSAFGTGKQDPTYKVSSIRDKNNKVFYSWTNQPERFTIVFAAPILLNLADRAIKSAADRVDTSGVVLQPGNAQYNSLGLQRITLLEPDLSVQRAEVKVEIADDPAIPIEGKLSLLVDQRARDLFKTFGDGSANDTYKVLSIKSADGTTVWSADETPAKYRLDFAAPIKLEMAKGVSKKLGGVKFVGLNFTDTPATSSYLDMAQKLLSGIEKSEEQITKDFLTSYKETENPTDYSALAYRDPRSGQPVATMTDMASTVPKGPVLVTNRIKVRAKYTALVAPGVIQTLERGAGATADGKVPKVVEILDEAEKPIWPLKAGMTFVDPGIDAIYIIGYDTMIDVPNTIKPYILSFMPSLAFLNPALPRRSASSI